MRGQKPEEASTGGEALAKQSWEDRNSGLLDGLRQNVRAELWRAVGLSSPLPAVDLAEWVYVRAQQQQLAGDRIRLYLPEGPARDRWAADQQRRSPRSLLDPRVQPIRRSGAGDFYVDAFVGSGGFGSGYLEPDIANPDETAWPNPHRRRGVQPLALVALAALDVARVTGALPGEATAFLLCDVACGHAFQFSGRLPGGVRIWAWDPFTTGDDLRAEYVAWRRGFIPRTRPKRPQAHTLELIRLVREMRPYPGRNPGNASWKDILDRWNATHERGRQYQEASISRAYAAALKRRLDLGILPADEEGGKQ